MTHTYRMDSSGQLYEPTEHPAKWQHRFMDIARMVASWSKDPSTKVGAIIVSPDRRHVFWGYNGFPRYVSDRDEWLNNREEKYPRVIHAEANALLMADRPIEGWTLYSTLMPCSQCAGMIIQKGLKRVVIPPVPVENYEHWQENFHISMQLFEQASVQVKELSHEF